MKKFARNQLARQLIDLPNCGGRSLKASRISSSRACADSMKTEQAEPLHEPIGGTLAVFNARIYAGRCQYSLFGT